jgi:amidophosphoribosyltransferase
MCGIVGIQGVPEAALEVYQGLLLLQHRGQDGAGILSYDATSREFHMHKDKGLVAQVFDKPTLEYLQGEASIGHTRYATIAVNMEELTTLLRDKHHRIMLSKNDAETLLNLISTQVQESMDDSPLDQLYRASERVFDEALGGYAIVGLWANGFMFGLRDPHGIRPLVLGKRVAANGKSAHILASESNVLNYLGFTFVRDIEPGEVVAIDLDGNVHTSLYDKRGAKSPCMFEWVYFATPESIMDGSPVYQARLNLGRELGNKIKGMMDRGEIEADVVVPVPESGRIAAIALSEATGVPYRELLIKNRYIQRSFILKDQESRNRAVKLKLMVIASELKGKRVLIVDDSIVRGTTSRRLIETIREAGAKEVHFVSTCPPIKHPCYFGIDFPIRDELIAAHVNEKALADALGADTVIYQDMEGLKKSLNQASLCTGCLTGAYPMDIKNAAKSFIKERQEAAKNT